MKPVYIVIETDEYHSKPNIIGVFEVKEEAEQLCHTTYIHREVLVRNLYGKDEYFAKIAYIVYTEINNAVFLNKESAEKYIESNNLILFGIKHVARCGYNNGRVEYYAGDENSDKDQMKDILLSTGADVIYWEKLR